MSTGPIGQLRGQASPVRHRSLVAAWSRVLAAFVLFCALVAVGSMLLQRLFPGHAYQGIRSQATLRLTGSAAGELAAVLLLILYLRIRNRTLADIGFRWSSSIRGWIAAAVLTALYVGLVLIGPLRGHAALAELSLFHFYNSIVAGFAAGFCEEIVFRGFVMSELSWAGASRVTQVLASGVLFGLAHVGWAQFASTPDPRILLGAVIPTTILGLLYAGIYLLSKRSLAPVIASHAITDVIIEPWLVLTALSGALGH